MFIAGSPHLCIYVINEVAIEERDELWPLLVLILRPREVLYVTLVLILILLLLFGGGGGYYAYEPHGGIGIAGIILIILVVLLLSGRLRA
jgi:hypothetical protein